jgi:hypothetical protein
MSQIVDLSNIGLKVSRTSSLSPTKAGRIYGRMVPSETKVVRAFGKDGIEDIPLNRRQRRVLARRVKHGSES